MKVRVIPAAGLTPDLIDAWRRIQGENPRCDSPFFAPEFTIAVAAVRDDVEIAVLTDHDVVGFFPFQRTKRQFGYPVGSKLSDFQGPVLRHDVKCEPSWLMRECGLRAWHFDHLVANDASFNARQMVATESPYVDLSQGFDNWCAERRHSGSQIVSRQRRTARKLAREVGPLRFELNTSDPKVFDAVLAWKGAQHRRTGVLQVLRYPWVIELLERVRDAESEHFSGWLSALYAGDHLVAVGFNIRGNAVLHSWMPAYDPQFAIYSPGMIMLLMLTEDAAAAGIRRLDLGKGNERYKRRFMTDTISLAEGVVTSRPSQELFYLPWYRGREWLRSSRLRPIAQVGKRLVRRFRYPSRDADDRTAQMAARLKEVPSADPS